MCIRDSRIADRPTAGNEALPHYHQLQVGPGTGDNIVQYVWKQPTYILIFSTWMQMLLLFTALQLSLWTEMTAKRNLQKLSFSGYHGCIPCTTPCFAVLWPQRLHLSNMNNQHGRGVCWMPAGKEQNIVKRRFFLLAIESRRIYPTKVVSALNIVIPWHHMIRQSMQDKSANFVVLLFSLAFVCHANTRRNEGGWFDDM